jgi:regulator of nucleoside diphosphate kinase
MTAMPLPSITLTSLDYQRLQTLIAEAPDRDHAGAEVLENEIERATVVPQAEIPPSVVTMNSRILVEDESTQERRELTLVYPTDSDPSGGKLSVLSPLGSALIGLSVGQSIVWELPRGRRVRVRVLEILFQPEASGRFDL